MAFNEFGRRHMGANVMLRTSVGVALLACTVGWASLVAAIEEKGRVQSPRQLFEGGSSSIQKFVSDRRGMPIREPVKVVTNLGKQDLEIRGTELQVEAINWQANPVETLCAAVKENQGMPFSGLRKPLPLLIIDADLLTDANFSTLQECSGGNLLSNNAKPLILVMPIAIRGPVVLSPTPDVLPTWITAQHFQIAAVRYLPVDGVSRFRQRGEWKQGSCKARDPQPALEDLQEALKSAKCVVLDSEGRRKIGEREARFVVFPLRTKHGEGPELNPSSIYYEPWPQDQNKISNWAYIDSNIKDQPIKIRVVTGDHKDRDDRANALLWDFCKRTAQYKSYLRVRDFSGLRRYREGICVWRSDVQMWKAVIWGDLSPDDRASGVFVDTMARFVEELSPGRAGNYKWMYPIAFGMAKKTQGDSPQEARDALLSAVMEGRYGLGDVIWLYMDPRSLENENVRKYLEAIRSSPVVSSGYGGGLAFFADILKLLSGR